MQAVILHSLVKYRFCNLPIFPCSPQNLQQSLKVWCIGVVFLEIESNSANTDISKPENMSIMSIGVRQGWRACLQISLSWGACKPRWAPSGCWSWYAFGALPILQVFLNVSYHYVGVPKCKLPLFGCSFM